MGRRIIAAARSFLVFCTGHLEPAVREFCFLLHQRARDKLTTDQMMLFTLFAVIIALLMWGRLRHDMVAFGGLISGVLLGLVPAETAFKGFAHPAVMTVALVLVVSAGMIRTGAVNVLARFLSRPDLPISVHILRVGGVGALLSAFMNNVTALALLMPIDVMTAQKAGRSVSLSLMALAFATILGGMVTLIGTPPNLIISGFREQAAGQGFAFFDFLKVGGIVAVSGLLFVAFVGWRLLPRRDVAAGSAAPDSHVSDYVAELVVPENSPAIGMTRTEFEAACEKAEALLIAINRKGRRVYSGAVDTIIELGDILLVEAAPAALEEVRSDSKLAYPDGLSADAPRVAGAGEVLVEVVVTEMSRINGRTARQLRLARDYDCVLLGILRQGRTIRDRLRDTRVVPGDILLMLVPEDREEAIAEQLRVLALDRREVVLKEKRAVLAVTLFVAAIGAVSIGLVTMPIALGAVMVGYVLGKVLSVEELYDHIDWPVIVLLASMIPLGMAMDSTGASAMIANALASFTQGQPSWVALTVLIVTTMVISDVLNNNATAILAAPVGLRLAEATQTNPDTYLMGIAIAASCAFLTPIGHQNNTIVMGPGGYRFADYWRMGLPLELIVITVGIPALLFFWPL